MDCEQRSFYFLCSLECYHCLMKQWSQITKEIELKIGDKISFFEIVQLEMKDCVLETQVFLYNRNNICIKSCKPFVISERSDVSLLSMLSDLLEFFLLLKGNINFKVFQNLSGLCVLTKDF